jgi:malate synthase
MTWEEHGMASDGVEITGPKRDRFDEVLTPGAVGLVAALHRELGGRRAELLAARAARQQELSAGGTLDFLAATQPIRDDRAWRVAAPAPGLVDRRVEITGPTDRKMTINALNSGAKV